VKELDGDGDGELHDVLLVVVEEQAEPNLAIDQ
jgi:hypothetical protein